MPIKPTFIISWSVWDEAVGHHYEPRIQSAKDLMYNLSIYKQQNEICLGIITPELQKVLFDVFGNNSALSFLFENSCDIEATQPLPIKVDGVEGHVLSIISQTILKTVKDSKNVFLITEDGYLKKLIDVISENLGIKCNVKNSKEALDILKERGYEIY